MTTSAPLTGDVGAPHPVARWQHTAVLIGILLALAVSGARYQVASSAAEPAHPPLVPLYLALCASEWALVYFVWRGIRQTGTTLRELIGGRWRTAADVAADVTWGVALWAVWSVVAVAWDRWIPEVGHARSVTALLPHGGVQIVLWIGLSISAGFAEELVFRGYCQRQFEAWTRRPWAAIVLQAALFGVAHGYQGVGACLRITAYGAMFGALARWRRSLRPGMIAHAWTDIASGVFRI